MTLPQAPKKLAQDIKTTLTLSEVIQMAVDHVRAARYAQAEKVIRAVLEKLPQMATAHDLLGAVLIQQRKYESAATSLDKALELNPALTSARSNRGFCWLANNEHAKAFDCFGLALQLQNDLMQAWEGAINAAANSHDWTSFAALLERYGRAVPIECREQVARMLGEIVLQTNWSSQTFEAFWCAMEKTILFARLPVAALSRLMTRENPKKDGVVEALTEWAGTGRTLDAFVAYQAMYRIWSGGATSENWTSLILEKIAPRIIPNATAGERKPQFPALNYTIQTESRWNEQIYKHVILPRAHIAAGTDDWTLLCSLEIVSAFSHGQQPATEAQAEKCFNGFRALLDEAGAKAYGAKTTPTIAKQPQRPLRIAFATLSGRLSPPGRVLVDLLRSAASLPERSWVPILLAVGDCMPEFENMLRTMRVPTINIDTTRGSFYRDRLQDRIEAVRQEIALNEIDILVHYELFNSVSNLISHARLAPVQVFWSMGHHFAPEGPQWDGFLSVGAPGQKIKYEGGKKWRAFENMISDPFAGQEGQNLQRAADKIRKERFADCKVILAAIGRSQKIDNDEFMDALAVVLKDAKDAIFLWFGDSKMDSVQNRLNSRGIAEQCFFEGWQHIPTYAKLIDIHLDSFPFPSNLSMYDTMAAGVPAVFLATPESKATGIPGIVEPLFQGTFCTQEDADAAKEIFGVGENRNCLWLCAKTPEAYAANVLRLIRDDRFRAEAGRANRLFMERFKFDLLRSSRGFTEHINEIVDDVRHRQDNVTKG